MIDNTLSEWAFALAKDTPAKLWWNAQAMHPAIFRALRIGASDPGAVYAVHPFRLAQIDGRHVILAAFPAPALFGEPDEDWLGIETVLAWNPVDNTVEVMGDTSPQLVGAFDHTDHGTIYGQAFAFFRTWAEQRAAFSTAYQSARAAHFTAAPAETDTPGMLIVGDMAKVRWSAHDLPATLSCVGADPATINKAILRDARLPRAVGGMRAAA